MEEKSCIRDLLLKTNHPLLDIRSRSLRSVIFKLNNELLSPLDLVNERDFLIHLLEWFNFEEWAMESQVLTLLSQLSEHEPAACTLVDIGGVEFLSQLRLHCDSSLHPLIDETLEHLLKLPRLHLPPSTITSANPARASHETAHPSSANSTHTPSNVAHSSTNSGPCNGTGMTGTFRSDYTSDIGSYNGCVPTPLSATQVPPQPNRVAHTQYPGRQTPSSSSEAPHTSSELAESVPILPHFQEGCSSSDMLSSWTSLVPEGAGLNFPYMASTAIPEAPRSQGSGGRGSDLTDCMRESDSGMFGDRFLWLRLTANDRHIFTTTQSRLINPSPESLLRSCEFIQDVLFQDFPAELFLQRPALINSLLHLFGGKSIHYPCLLCLLTYTRKLKLRVNLRNNPLSTITDLTSAHDKSHWSHDQMPHPQVGVDQGELEFLSSDAIHGLQSSQLTIMDVCFSIVKVIAPLITDYLNKDFPWMSDTNERGSPPIRTPAAYVHVCLQILKCIVELMEAEDNNRSKRLSPHKDNKMKDCIGTLCSVISQTQSKWRRMSTQMTGASSPQMQLVCCVTLELGHYLSRVLWLSRSEVGCEKMTYDPALTGVLQGLMLNGVVGAVFPDLQDSLLKVFGEVDPPNHRLFNKIKLLSKAFEKMSLFLSYSETTPLSPPSSPGGDKLKRLNIADDALSGLWFMCDRKFLTSAVNLCLGCLMESDVSSKEWKCAKELLMKFLCHGDRQTQEETYKHFTDYLKNTLSVSNTPLNSSILVPSSSSSSSTPPQPSTSGRNGLRSIILDWDILCLLVVQGALFGDDVIAPPSLCLLGDLLSMKEDLFWPELRDAIIHLLPYIEVGVVENDRVSGELKDLLSSCGGTDAQLPPLIQLKSLLRLLYSCNIEVRIWSYSHLSKFILLHSGEDNSIPSQNSVPYHDILLAGKCHREVNLPMKSGGPFKHEDVMKLLHIIRSETMELMLKKSALEQLSLLLQDYSLRERVLEDGLSNDLINLLKSVLCRREDSLELDKGDLVSMLKPCVNCLLVLASPSPNVRAIFSESMEFMMLIFKAALWCYKDPEMLYSASKLLTLLVFEKEMRMTDGSQITIPAPLRDRLKFPFEIGAYNIDYGYPTPSPLDPNLYSSEPLLSMLRLQYLSSTLKDTEEVLNSQKSGKLDEKLQLPSSDLVSLRCLCTRESLTDYFNHLMSATSHKKVIEMLQHISVLLHVSHCIESRGGCGIEGRGISFPGNIQTLWRNVIERFLKVSPSTPQDHTLLASVLFFLSDLLSFSPCTADSASSPGLVTHKELSWLSDVCLSSNSIPMQLLESLLDNNATSQASGPQRSLQKAILQFYVILLRCLASDSLHSTEKLDPLPLVMTLDHYLHVAGSPNYYDIPLLELSLECLLHLTDEKLLGSVFKRSLLGLSMKIMSSLRQVLLSFMSGRENMGESFMGKGVISKGSLALCHLVHTTETRLHPPEEWWYQWLQFSDLMWLQYLVKDREPNVRYAGLCLLASLCIKPGVIDILLSSWSDLHPFSLWGVCVKIGLNTRETSLVRKQAFLLLTGLSAVCNKEKKWSHYLSYTTEDMALAGEGALELLLNSQNFFETLQCSLHSEAFLHLVSQIPPLLAKLGVNEKTLSILIPVSKYIGLPCQQKTEVGNGGVVSQLISEGHPLLYSIISDVFSCCDLHVISSFCSLLHNLHLAFPDFMMVRCHDSAIILQLTSLIQPEVTGAFFLAESRGIIDYLLLSSWTQMCVKLLNLLNLVLTIKPDSVLPFILRDGVTGGLSRMLAQCEAFRGSLGSRDLASAITSLLLSLVTMKSPSTGKEQVFSSLQLYWPNFIGLLLHSLESSSTSSALSLSTNCLKLLSCLLSRQFRPHPPMDPVKRKSLDSVTFDPPHAEALAYLLDSNGQNNKAEVHCGGVLCHALMKVVEKHRLINSTLSILLACSSSAKQMALDGGLLELCAEELKNLHAKLCVETLEHPLPIPRRKKESPILLEILNVVGLLRNFMYKSEAVKTACVRIQLPRILHKLWPSCTVSRSLLLSIVNLLVVYTSHHFKGCASLASSTKGTPCLLQDVLKHTSHSLSCYYSCVSAKMGNPYTEVLAALFTLLANCSFSQECRAIIKKTGFIGGFSRVQPKNEKTVSFYQERVSSMWVRLLVNLSFSTEGQAGITKAPGMMEALMDTYSSAHPETQVLCLLILRNLSFHGPSKAVLVNNRNILNILTSSLESCDLLRVTFAVSALWALVYNSSKVRNLLKKCNLKDKFMTLSTSDHFPSLTLSLLSREQCVKLSEEAITQTMKILQY